ncbi:hypothetical protein J0B03_02990 [Alkalibacter rhizosphaerae]|uniref:Uncharacterized protein n=1 Tax=Alkalibacter rhizosphaerae TaxID=2815577 RepID=A0A975AHX1_9FIRM|nr:hypothetical protein [Alkalibacter rhizosphaerae]QSX09049.1 hypothetical protein J0B03_02990 [Alkalibacter rhizosphaerae]
MTLYQLGRVLGYLIVFFYLMALMNFVFKWIHRTFRESMKKNEGFYKRFTTWMLFFVKNHRLFGALAVVFVLVHFSVQYFNLGFSNTGAIAAALMIVQATLGGYGSRKKSAGKGWLYVHRIIPVLLLLAMANHIL